MSTKRPRLGLGAPEHAQSVPAEPISLLAALPIEIIERIIVETMPEGLLQFSSTCRLLRQLSKPHFPLHQALRSDMRELRVIRHTDHFPPEDDWDFGTNTNASSDDESGDDETIETGSQHSGDEIVHNNGNIPSEHGPDEAQIEAQIGETQLDNHGSNHTNINEHAFDETDDGANVPDEVFPNEGSTKIGVSHANFPFTSSYEVLLYIAECPVAASYIESANLWGDTADPLGHQVPTQVPDMASDDAIVALFSHSRHLREAGVDWRSFLGEIGEDLAARRFSQNAAAFLLTLLPRVTILTLPHKWKQTEQTTRLMRIVARDVHHQETGWVSPSLDTLRWVDTSNFQYYIQRESSTSAMRTMWPFLLMPNLSTMAISGAVLTGSDIAAHVGIDYSSAWTTNVETLILEYSWVDCEAIMEFAKHAPNLTTLHVLFASYARPEATR